MPWNKQKNVMVLSIMTEEVILVKFSGLCEKDIILSATATLVPRTFKYLPDALIWSQGQCEEVTTVQVIHSWVLLILVSYASIMMTDGPCEYMVADMISCQLS